MSEIWGYKASHVARCSCSQSVTASEEPLEDEIPTNLAFFRHASTSAGNDAQT